MTTAPTEPKAYVVLCTAPEAEAGQLARKLVETRLVACVNLIDSVRSVYRWKGAVSEDREALLVIKTATDRLAELQERLVELHSYDVPEIIALPVVAGSASYLEWIGQVTREPTE